MAKDRGVNMPTAQRSKGALKPSPASAPSTAVVAPAAPKKKTSPSQFVQEVRQEVRKITWPSWRETWLLSVMVLIMVVVTALFFLVVDTGLRFAVTEVLKLAS